MGGRARGDRRRAPVDFPRHRPHRPTSRSTATASGGASPASRAGGPAGEHARPGALRGPAGASTPARPRRAAGARARGARVPGRAGRAAGRPAAPRSGRRRPRRRGRGPPTGCCRPGTCSASTSPGGPRGRARVGAAPGAARDRRPGRGAQRCAPTAPLACTCDPWPFAGEAVELPVAARVIEDRPYAVGRGSPGALAGGPLGAAPRSAARAAQSSWYLKEIEQARPVLVDRAVLVDRHVVLDDLRHAQVAEGLRRGGTRPRRSRPPRISRWSRRSRSPCRRCCPWEPSFSKGGGHDGPEGHARRVSQGLPADTSLRRSDPRSLLRPAGAPA